MSEISELAKRLYDDFFKRDVLGKLGPGAIVLVSLRQVLDPVQLPITGGPWSTLQWLAAISVAYVTGIALQTAGEFVGLHFAAARPLHAVLPYGSKWKQAMRDFRTRMTLIRSASPEQWSKAADAQRERYVVLKECTGNTGLALAIVAATVAATGAGIIVILATALLAAMGLASHISHGRRQADFEIGTLVKSGLLKESEGREMRSIFVPETELPKVGEGK